MEPGARIRSEDVIGCGGDGILDAPVDSSFEHILIIVVKPEDKTAIDHDAQIVQPLNSPFIIDLEILELVALFEVVQP